LFLRCCFFIDCFVLIIALLAPLLNYVTFEVKRVGLNPFFLSGALDEVFTGWAKNVLFVEVFLWAVLHL
jgi:hypothetical protein